MRPRILALITESLFLTGLVDSQTFLLTTSHLVSVVSLPCTLVQLVTFTRVRMLVSVMLGMSAFGG